MRAKPRARRRLSLRARFLLGFTTLITALAVMITVFAGYRFAQDLEQQLWKLGQATAESVAKEALFFAVFQGRTDLASVAESVVAGDVLYVQIVHNGQVLAEKKTLQLELPVQRLLPGLHSARRQLPDGTAYVDFERSFVGREVTPPQAGVQRELVSSYVRLGISLATVHREIRQGLIVVAGVSLAVIVAGSLLVLLLYQRIMRPIEGISAAMQRFGRGQTAVRAQVHSHDELETLAHSFNQMADALVKKDKEMHQVNLELQGANRAKSEFLAAMSHDLKTPLHVISGYAQLLLAGDGGKTSPAQRSHLESILKSGDQLLEFIERILRFSKSESGVEAVRFERVDVARLTEEVLGPLRALARRKGLSFDRVLPPSLWARADPAKLKQVLANLVENAIKYTERGGVRVQLADEGQTLRWTIQDSGPGIPKRFEALIFEPFGRLHNYPGKMVAGTGLGLAIVKRYVEVHQGRIGVHSVPGQGSTFTVDLPKEVKEK